MQAKPGGTMLEASKCCVLRVTFRFSSVRVIKRTRYACRNVVRLWDANILVQNK